MRIKLESRKFVEAVCMDCFDVVYLKKTAIFRPNIFQEAPAAEIS
jgi:hypothetical protein